MGRKLRVKKERKQREKKKKDDVFRIILKSNAFLKTLPSKSDIGRCRCVCKQWRSFLSTPEFNRAHLQNHQVTIDDYKLLVYDGNITYPLAPFRTFSLNETLPPFPHDHQDIDIFLKASLDGLVCVALRGWMSATLVLTNPLTDVSKKMPPMPIAGYSATMDPIGFYIDPASNNNNDYKLLCVPYFGFEGACVYSQRLDSWTHIEFSVPLPCELSDWSPATFYRQCLYFKVTRCDSTHSILSKIIRFDVKTETFKEMPVPDLANATCYSSAGLVVLAGCLHMYVSYRISDVIDKVEVWRMNDDDDEWEKVDAFTQDQQQEQFICTETIGNWLAVMDLHDNSFKKMSTEEFKTHYRCFSSSALMRDRLIYVQTLVEP